MARMMTSNIAITSKITLVEIEPEFIESYMLHLATTKHLIQLKFASILNNYVPAVL